MNEAHEGRLGETTRIGLASIVAETVASSLQQAELKPSRATILRIQKRAESRIAEVENFDPRDPFFRLSESQIQQYSRSFIDEYARKLTRAFLHSLIESLQIREDTSFELAKRASSYFEHYLRRQLESVMVNIPRPRASGEFDRQNASLQESTPKFRGPRPAPQNEGVTDFGAEKLVKDWLVHYGISDAHVTRQSRDGGADVVSKSYVAEVKNYTGTVGAPVIRQLLGVATSEKKLPMHFTSGTYSQDAQDFAARNKIPLFRYNAKQGTLDGVNASAAKFLREASFQAEQEGLREKKLSVIKDNVQFVEDSIRQVRQMKSLICVMDAYGSLSQETVTKYDAIKRPFDGRLAKVRGFLARIFEAMNKLDNAITVAVGKSAIESHDSPVELGKQFLSQFSDKALTDSLF